MNMVYFDNSATTKPLMEVINEVADCMEQYFANPSSAHRLGIEAERKLKQSKINVSCLLGAAPDEIIFTSGGSESNNTALRGLVSAGDHVITSKIEHPSVLQTMKELERSGVETTYLDVDSRGIINLDNLKKSFNDNTRLVSIMHVNNEIGSIQPIEEIVRAARRENRRIKIHVDAVQSAGKLPLDVKKLDVDLLSISAHKIHGPKGIGALYIRKGLRINPLIFGGGQETGLRSGTENLPGICGFGTAVQIVCNDMSQKVNHINKLKRYFIDMLSAVDGIVINSPEDDFHTGSILNVSFEGLRGEVLLHALEDYNIYVSTGSACSSRKSSHRNYVLPAIGLKECHVEGTIRFSFSYLNTMAEIDYTIDALKKIIPFLRRIKR